MPHFDPLSLLDHRPPEHTEEFTDPAQPGFVVKLTVKKLEAPEQALVVSLTKALVDTWVNPPEGKEPTPWPPPSPMDPRPRRIRWNEGFCQLLAVLEAAQCPRDPTDRWDAMELAILSLRMPQAWDDIWKWYNRVTGDDPGNASAAREATSCAPPAISDAPTPASTSTSARDCEGSTPSSDGFVSEQPVTILQIEPMKLSGCP